MIRAQIISERPNVDSIRAVINNSRNDTSKVKIINKLVLQLTYTGGYRIADSLVSEELQLATTLNYKAGIANAYNSKGILANYESDYLHSLQFLIKSLKLYEDINDKDGMGLSYKFIGSVYAHQSDTAKALGYYNKALNIFSIQKDTDNIAITFLAFGRLYDKAGIPQLALKNYNKAFSMFFNHNNKEGLASALLFSGTAYKNEKLYDSARSCALRSKALFEEVNDNDGLSGSYHLLGLVSLADGKYTEALSYEKKALEIGRKIAALDCIMDAEEAFYQIYEKMGDGQNTLIHYKAFTIARDSIFNQQSTLKTLSAEMNYANENKEAAQKAQEEKKLALQNEETKRNKAVTYFASVILLVLIVFSIFVFRTNIQRKKDNKEIEAKNFQITQSINYAERIQRSMLPASEEIHTLLPESFVFFKPKDIVSGDFYFIQKKEGKVILAVADCTGHGVPGGFMSMLCSEKLNEAIYETQNSGEILGILNRGIKSSLHQMEGEDAMYDGMDIALCVISPTVNGMKLSFSGALRPIWIFRDGSNDMEEVNPVSGTIGGFTPVDQDYPTYIIQLQKGDTFYLFTDGFTDQFGGDLTRKFGTRRLKDLFISIHKMPMEMQQKELDASIDNWMADNLQLDDMLVVGVRV